MPKAFKYRIYLANGQRRILEQQLEECRWLYNETLATRKNAWQQEQRTVDWYETKRALPLLKDTRPSLKLVHSQVLQNVTERVELAFKAFFRRLKAGEAEVGYPRFKGRGPLSQHHLSAVRQWGAARRRPTDPLENRRGASGPASPVGRRAQDGDAYTLAHG
jgi:transposase